MRRIAGLAVLAGAAALSLLYWRQAQTTPFIVSGFLEADVVRVGSRVGGRVAETCVAEGQQVPTGTVLFRIAPFDLQQRQAQAQAELAAHQADLSRLHAGFRTEEVEQALGKRDRAAAELDKLRRGPRPQEIEVARQELAIAQANLALARSEHERLTRLRAENQAAATEIDRGSRDLATAEASAAIAAQKLALLEEGTRVEDIAEAKAALAEAQSNLTLLERGFRPEDIAQAQAEVDAAQARAAAIEVQLRELDVLSPCDCVVEAIDLHAGDLVGQNAPAVSLLDPANLWVRTYVPEARLGQVGLAQRVAVRVDNFPDDRFIGEITFIAREAEFTPRNIQTPEERSKQVFRIKVTLRNGIDRLRVGMSADVHFDEAVDS